MKKICTYISRNDGYLFDTSCNSVYLERDNPYGRVDIKYCPFCGKKIKVKSKLIDRE